MIGALSARARAQYPGASLDGIAPSLEVTITEEVGSHTLIRAVHSGSPDYFTRGLVTESPMRIDTSSRYGQRAWFGYVTDVAPMVDDNQGRTVITGVGITYPMKETSDRVWKNGTVSDYLNDMIYGVGLVPYVEQSDIWQTVPQAGRTDWQVANEIAASAGLNIFVTGSTVNALTNEATMAAFYSQSPILKRAALEERPDLMDSLREISYLDARPNTTARVAASVDPVTGESIQFSAGSGWAAYGAADARSLPTLVEKTTARKTIAALSLRARVRGPGNILVGAGRPVFLDDRGEQSWWLCQKVTHSFNEASGVYSMEALLRRDSSLLDMPPPPAYPRRSDVRVMDRFCLCREHDPLLVGQSRARYVTSQPSSAGTEPDIPADSDVTAWIQGGPLFVAGKPLGTPRPWVSTARWRARGRCDWQ